MTGSTPFQQVEYFKHTRFFFFSFIPIHARGRHSEFTMFTELSVSDREIMYCDNYNHRVDRIHSHLADKALVCQGDFSLGH